MNKSCQTFFGFTKEPFINDIRCEDILVTPEIEAVAERIQYTVRLGAVSRFFML